jgi:hypothetical protein
MDRPDTFVISAWNLNEPLSRMRKKSKQIPPQLGRSHVWHFDFNNNATNPMATLSEQSYSDNSIITRTCFTLYLVLDSFDIGNKVELMPFESRAAQIIGHVYKIYCSKCGWTQYEEDWFKAEKLRDAHPCRTMLDSIEMGTLLEDKANWLRMQKDGKCTCACHKDGGENSSCGLCMNFEG